MQTMGERIKMLRIAKGLTQTELGDLVGAAKTTVSQWENDGVNDIKLKTFLLLVEALGTRYEYLVYGPKSAAR